LIQAPGEQCEDGKDEMVQEAKGLVEEQMMEEKEMQKQQQEVVAMEEAATQLDGIEPSLSLASGHAMTRAKVAETTRRDQAQAMAEAIARHVARGQADCSNREPHDVRGKRDPTHPAVHFAPAAWKAGRKRSAEDVECGETGIDGEAGVGGEAAEAGVAKAFRKPAEDAVEARHPHQRLRRRARPHQRAAREVEARPPHAPQRGQPQPGTEVVHL